MKLDLGAGPLVHPGFTPVDIESTEVRYDLGRFPWPVPDSAVGEVLASHILEHFDRHDGRRFLSECYRILQPGGILRLAVPDYDVFADCIVSGFVMVTRRGPCELDNPAHQAFSLYLDALK